MSQSTKPHGGRSFWALAVLLLAHALPVGLLVSRPDAGSEAWDQNFHHAVLVSRFAQTWDRPDFTNYPSATSPGYHYLLGLVSRAGLVPTESLRELYPWTAPEIEQSEMVRRSRLAQGMSQWIDSGQETILLQIEQDGSGGVARESVERVRGGLCDGEDAEGLARDFGPVGTAMVCRARGDLPGEWAAMDRYRQVLMPLRVVQLLASLAALTVIWLVATRLGLSSWAAAAVALPAAWNPYVLAGGAWITTDCIAMLCASLVLFDVVGNAQRERPPGWLAAGGMIAAVLVRQSFLWVEGAVVVAALLPILMGDRPGWRKMLPSMVAIVIPLAIVGAMAWSWGGLVPPAYRSRHGEAFNPSALLVFLSVVFLWGAGIAVFLRGDRFRRVTGVVVVAGILACIPLSSFDKAAGRFGGMLWSVAQLGPTIADRSLVMITGAALGAGVCVLYARSMRGRGHGREMLVIAGAMVLLAASLMVNPKSWERYAEVPVVLMLPLLAAAAVRGNSSGLDRRVGLVSLATALVALGLSYSMLLRAPT